MIIFARTSLKGLCFLGARFVGQLVPCPVPGNETVMCLKKQIAGLQEGTRRSVSLFENDLTDALNGWTDCCMKSNKSFSLCDIEVSSEKYPICVPYLRLQG